MKGLYGFFHSDAAGGIILMIAATLAMVVANSPLLPFYETALHHPLPVVTKPFHFWVNDLLMAFFFLLAGLEIKREILKGIMSTWRQATIYLLTALCGMGVPALIFMAINHPYPEFHQGWAVPAATDIAFALGVLALVSSRIPLVIKAMLMIISVLDDLAAIMVIVFFYSEGITLIYLLAAAGAGLVLVYLNRRVVDSLIPYFMAGAVLWWALLNAGIHPTLAGVLLGLSIPMMSSNHSYSLVESLQDRIHPWIVFGVLPIFGFANAGVSLSGMQWSDLLHPVTLGIMLGLFLGKQIGIFGFLYLAIKSPYFHMPKDVSWLHIYGMSLLCGIGFTMALFVGNLAFPAPDMTAYVRMGVIGGSLLSGVFGYAVLRFATSRPLQPSYE